MSIRVRYALTTGGLLLVLVFAALLVYSGVTLGQVGGAAAGSGVVGGSATAGGIGAVGGVGIAAGTAVAIEAMRTLGAVLGPRLGVASSADAVRRLTTAVGALTEVVRAQQQRIDEMHLIVTQRDDEGRPKVWWPALFAAATQQQAEANAALNTTLADLARSIRAGVHG